MSSLSGDISSLKLFCHLHVVILKSLFCPVGLAQVEDLKAKLAVQEVELWQRNTDIEALIAKIGQQTDRLNQERAVADGEEQRVRMRVCVSYFKYKRKVL